MHERVVPGAGEILAGAARAAAELIAKSRGEADD